MENCKWKWPDNLAEAVERGYPRAFLNQAVTEGIGGLELETYESDPPHYGLTNKSGSILLFPGQEPDTIRIESPTNLVSESIQGLTFKTFTGAVVAIRKDVGENEDDLPTIPTKPTTVPIKSLKTVGTMYLSNFISGMRGMGSPVADEDKQWAASIMNDIVRQILRDEGFLTEYNEQAEETT